MTRPARAFYVVMDVVFLAFTFIIVGALMSVSEYGPATKWCTENGGSIPSLYSNPLCITPDGRVLVMPSNANAKWPG